MTVLLGQIGLTFIITDNPKLDGKIDISLMTAVNMELATASG